MAIWNERIKQLRKSKDITLKDVAEYIGTTEATAQRYESGNGIKNIPYEVIVKYSELFNCSPSYLMGWEEEEKLVASMFVTSTSPEIQLIVEATKDMSAKQLDRLLKYAKYLKYEEED